MLGIMCRIKLGWLGVTVVAAGLLLAAPNVVWASSAKVFATPEAAADALVIAIAARREAALEEILGEDWKNFIPLEGIDRSDVDRFLDAWIESHAVQYQSFDHAVLAVGSEDWTLPIPIVHGTQGWQFDVKAGHEEILIRRIGRNELAVINACLAFFDAQQEYALTGHRGDRVLEYAQRLISTPGQQDGLYWAALPGEEPSPLGPFYGSDEPGNDYHGYHFRILQGQGETAPGGAYSYLINGRMVAGFALVAWPSAYGATGIMTFLINHDGRLYQSDLGPETDTIAPATTVFDPDATWALVETP